MPWALRAYLKEPATTTGCTLMLPRDGIVLIGRTKKRRDLHGHERRSGGEVHAGPEPRHFGGLKQGATCKDTWRAKSIGLVDCLPALQKHQLCISRELCLFYVDKDVCQVRILSKKKTTRVRGIPVATNSLVSLASGDTIRVLSSIEFTLELVLERAQLNFYSVTALSQAAKSAVEAYMGTTGGQVSSSFDPNVVSHVVCPRVLSQVSTSVLRALVCQIPVVTDEWVLKAMSAHVEGLALPDPRSFAPVLCKSLRNLRERDGSDILDAAAGSGIPLAQNCDRSLFFEGFTIVFLADRGVYPWISKRCGANVVEVHKAGPLQDQQRLIRNASQMRDVFIWPGKSHESLKVRLQVPGTVCTIKHTQITMAILLNDKSLLAGCAIGRERNTARLRTSGGDNDHVAHSGKAQCGSVPRCCENLALGGARSEDGNGVRHRGASTRGSQSTENTCPRLDLVFKGSATSSSKAEEPPWPVPDIESTTSDMDSRANTQQSPCFRNSSSSNESRAQSTGWIRINQKSSKRSEISPNDVHFECEIQAPAANHQRTEYRRKRFRKNKVLVAPDAKSFPKKWTTYQLKGNGPNEGLSGLPGFNRTSTLDTISL